MPLNVNVSVNYGRAIHYTGTSEDRKDLCKARVVSNSSSSRSLPNGANGTKNRDSSLSPLVYLYLLDFDKLGSSHATSASCAREREYLPGRSVPRASMLGLAPLGPRQAEGGARVLVIT